MKIISLAAALLAGSLSVGAAHAMPNGTPTVQSNVVNVDYECGRGWHVTPWGDCKPNRWRRPPPPEVFFGGPQPPWGWDEPHRGWDRPRWRDERAWRGDDRGWRDGDRGWPGQY
ncbi:hypothetical protein ELI41_32030 (plasmid) [Rhizobium leguminosarum]|jgi:hypothetical protein|uniref:Integral membrane protein n=1 Tax=Rhizobium leguminosarum TaxID=384 RepID=A0ABD7PK00_RHILE|nr:hypothetical protein [Rhizobium leguminosarum]TAU79598.1 hypothetical protein ELI41_32030 [Rhizobium leguminosarum]TAV64724.1 hypothetical protein ELI28_28140 [Rhizobium leguminosarum]TAV65182.1 hypothetical protein ELI27_30675 [Rhizobium leguminosarum]TAW25171.1 hypothetical protein ELI19_27385 [Rhizobium leguminosarum]TAW38942.1 hypothetical protein ELI18_27355 [Rhizobium leguminosarum]